MATPTATPTPAGVAGRSERNPQLQLRYYLFAFRLNEAVLNESHLRLLKGIVSVFRLDQEHPETTIALIEGYTDQSGPERVNAPLRQRRADAAAQAFLRLGVPTTRIAGVRGAPPDCYLVSGTDQPLENKYNRAVDITLRDARLNCPLPSTNACRPTTTFSLDWPPPADLAGCRLARASRLPGPIGTQERPWGDFYRCRESWELAGACGLADAPTTLSGLSRSKGAVLNWLRAHQNEIIAAEETWSVDRRAIAGAIAYEALENRQSWARRTGRSVGPGKIHIHNWGVGRTPMVREVEQAGYFRYVGISKDQLNQHLATPHGAADGIAAIMRAAADVVTHQGNYPPEWTYWNPPVLTTWYHGKYLSDLRKIYATKKYPAPLDPGDMGVWVQSNLTFIEEAVGKLPEGCRPCPIPPIPGTLSDQARRERAEALDRLFQRVFTENNLLNVPLPSGPAR